MDKNKQLESIEKIDIKFIQDCGESDGVCKILWLKDLNGVCDIEVEGKHCTDVLGAYVGEDGLLSISVFSADDKANLFVSLYELPDEVIKEIHRQAYERYWGMKTELEEATKTFLEHNGGYYCWPDDTTVQADGSMGHEGVYLDLEYCGEKERTQLISLELNEFDEMFLVTRAEVYGEETDPFCDFGNREMVSIMKTMGVDWSNYKLNI